MMPTITLLAPLFFYAGLAAAVGAVALHFIVTRQPPSSVLPTARFVPEGSVRVTTIAPPTDRWLLLLRVLFALAIGLAFARPLVTPRLRPLARLVLADVSQAVGAIGAVRDSARSLLQDGDVLVVFDSTAHAVTRGARDSAATLMRTTRPGRLSPALIVALRSAARLRTAVDSFELVVVSPLRAAELDGATAAIRRLWPGRMRLVPVPAVAESLIAGPVGVTVLVAQHGTPRAAQGVMPAASGLDGAGGIGDRDDDPVALAATVNGLARPGAALQAAVRIVRQAVGTTGSADAAAAADSVWAAGAHHTLVRWPDTGAPPGWLARPTIDTVGAVVAMGVSGAGASGVDPAALVVPLERRWRLDPARRPARIVARWIDGEPAAVEYRVGEGCLRDVAVPVPTRGDRMLQPSFAHFLEALSRPCALTASGPAADERTLAWLAGTGPLAARAAIAPPVAVATPLVPWLLGLALLLALAELIQRRRST